MCFDSLLLNTRNLSVFC